MRVATTTRLQLKPTWMPAKADVLVHAPPSGSGADSLVLLVVRERSHDDLALCRGETFAKGWKS